MRLFRTFLASIVIHIIAGVVVFYLQKSTNRISPDFKKVEVVELSLVDMKPRKSKTLGKASKASAQKKFGITNLRPYYMKEGSLFVGMQKKSTQGESDPSGIQNSYARELLFTDPKVVKAFDLLAEKINQYLDFPTILIENGIQGIATLDLYFDTEGNVDEARSKIFGYNKSVRGLLVKAARIGIIKWFVADSFLLKKEQFKDQHFRAEFVISHTLVDSSRLEKTGLGSYTFLRRRYVHTCAQPTGVDLACLAVRAYGAVRSHVGTSYRIKFQALQDQLEHYDRLGLSGISEQIQGV